MREGLYQTDALAWADEQASLLRRLAAGERVNAQIDWPHVIEEVQDVGLSELRACQSLLLQAMLHLMKIAAAPADNAAGHWRDEAAVFLADAENRFAPSMRQRLELARLYTKARRLAGESSDAAVASAVFPEECPFGIEALLAGDVETLVGRLSGASRR